MFFLLYTHFLAVSGLMLCYTEHDHYQHNESKQVRSYTDFIITDKPSWLNPVHISCTAVIGDNCRIKAIKLACRTRVLPDFVVFYGVRFTVTSKATTLRKR